MNNIPPQAQQILAQMQTFQQQFQTVMMQKESFSIQKLEAEKALEELAKSESDEVYKAVGPVLVKSTKKEVVAELKEKLELAEVRLKSLDSQEAKIKERAEEAQKKLQEMMQSGQKEGAEDSAEDGEAG